MFFTIVIISTGLMGCKSNIERIEDYLSSKEYSKAVKRVDILKKDEEINEADNLIKNEIENLKSRYVDGEIDGTLAISEIEKLRSSTRTDVNNVIDEAKENIHMRMNSKKAFNDGVKFEEQGQYEDALESYNYVSEDDTENYNEALERISSLISKLKEEQVLRVVETNVIVTSKTHKDIYPDQLQIIFKNDGTAPINKFKVAIFAYDAENNPIKINNGVTEDYIFIGLGEKININPGELWGYNYGWAVPNDNIDRIEAYVECAEYADGTVWKNPLYTQWVRIHWTE
ncbi:MAG: DUF5780 domain-containing protein [Clostridium sp.]